MAMATAAQGAIGLAGGAAKFFEGRKTQRQAQELIDNFEWQDLENAYTNKQVSTLGSDLMREENARAMSTATGALREGGSRALIGGLGKVVSQSNTMNREIAANLDEQQKALDLAAAEDDVRIRSMVEERQANELAGYGEMLQQGRSMKNAGFSEGLNAIGTLGTGVAGVISSVKGGTGLFGLASPPQTGSQTSPPSASVSIPRTSATGNITNNYLSGNMAGITSGMSRSMGGRNFGYDAMNGLDLSNFGL